MGLKSNCFFLGGGGVKTDFKFFSSIFCKSPKNCLEFDSKQIFFLVIRDFSGITNVEPDWIVASQLHCDQFRVRQSKTCSTMQIIFI